MVKIRAFLTLSFFMLGSCGPSAEERQAEADRAANEAAERDRLAAENACLTRAAESFNQTLGKSFSVGFSALNSISLDSCPQDILEPFASYKYALRDAGTVVAAIGHLDLPLAVRAGL